MAKMWKILEKFDNKSFCCFCKLKIADEFRFGKIYQYANINVHYFCLLFATNLRQHGRDEDGLLGFLFPDIQQELSRNGKVICCYCKETGASCCCGSRKCEKKFHFPCGLKNNTFHTFRGTFRSFCPEHSIKPAVPSCFFSQESLICIICREGFENLQIKANVVYAACCNNLCFHKPCIQKMALNAGYFFKCPNCNDKRKFRNSMLNQGIYIPNEDAAWELVPNSFRELYEQYNYCDARNCLCPFGQSHSDSSGCNMCGSHGIHRKCGKNVIHNREEWTCCTCSGAGASVIANDCTLNIGRSRRSVGSSRRTSVYGIKNRDYQSTRNEITQMTLRSGKIERKKFEGERRIRCTISGTRVSILPSCKKQLKRLKIVL